MMLMPTWMWKVEGGGKRDSLDRSGRVEMISEVVSRCSDQVYMADVAGALDILWAAVEELA